MAFTLSKLQQQCSWQDSYALHSYRSTHAAKFFTRRDHNAVRHGMVNCWIGNSSKVWQMSVRVLSTMQQSKPEVVSITSRC